MEPMPRKRSLAERWREVRPTKTAMFWSWVVVVVLTLVVGFEWGGWVTGKTARSMAEAAGHDAVVARLAPMCVNQATHDPQWAEKRKALGTTESWDRPDYVVKQGWAIARGATGGPARGRAVRHPPAPEILTPRGQRWGQVLET
jgi:hypothetical protein